MKSAIVLGSNSDIMKAITPMMEADGWKVEGWKRNEDLPLLVWDVCIIAIGQVAPVGLWHEQGNDWERCVRSNLFVPLHLLKRVWYRRRTPESTVIWFAGSNPQTIMDGYSAYNTSKMAVLKLVEQLDHETPDCKFVALGPGVCATKIHSETILKGWDNPRLARALKDGSFTKMEDVYATLKWCVEQPKEVVGGRNICVSDLNGIYTPGYLERVLKSDQSRFKLRRQEGAMLE